MLGRKQSSAFALSDDIWKFSTNFSTERVKTERMDECKTLPNLELWSLESSAELLVSLSVEPGG